MLPFQGIPYGAAPAWCFHLNEFGTYIFFLLCFFHARKRGGVALTYLLGGLIFGLALEYFEVLGGSYTYGRFYVMLGRPPLDVPLCIGCGWAIILYTTRLFSDALGLPVFAAAAFDTLLALNIDLSMDVVAYRMHMWHWDWRGTGLNPLTAHWFGIPYGNFVGWITVVFSYSLFSRIFERGILKRGILKRWIAPEKKAGWVRFSTVGLLAITCSLGILFGSEAFAFPFLAKYLGLRSAFRLIILIVTMLLLIFFGWKSRRPSAEPLSPLAQWVPGWLHVFFAFCFFALGFYRENKWMTLVTGINFLIGIGLHTFPLHTIPRRSVSQVNDAPAHCQGHGLRAVTGA